MSVHVLPLIRKANTVGLNLNSRATTVLQKKINFFINCASLDTT